MKNITTEKAPKAIGPYSQGIKVQNSQLIFVSGQLPIDPISGKLLDGNIQQLTSQVIKNMVAIVNAGGGNISSIVRVDIFLLDMHDFKEMNEEYARHFKGPNFPVRQTIQVAGLPLNARIEMSCVAII
ncbi:MAG: hypothetical protein HY860_02995 [Chlamydiales bacterium]|nr:hypothetical protein [Chlamydiales bacterium]